MASYSRRRRAGAQLLDGRRRAEVVARRLGVAIREARLGAGLNQSQIATATRVSQPQISRLERGQGATASIETWASVAAAAGTQLAAFLEELPGATRPRDYEHLKRQQLVIETARFGGWTPTIEQAINRAWERHRSIDVRLVRPSRRESAIVEIWDWFDDVGAAFRGLDAKVTATEREHLARELTGSGSWRVAGLIVVRGTRRNRQLVQEFVSVFRARFPGSGRAWLDALRASDSPMPEGAGFLWTDVRGGRLFGARF